jgi:hypothetical protein
VRCDGEPPPMAKLAQVRSEPGPMTSEIVFHERSRALLAPVGAPWSTPVTSRAAAAPPDPGSATRSPDGPRRRSEHAAPGDRRTLEGISARTRPGALGRLAFETSVTIIRERVGSHADAHVVRVQSGIHRDQEEGLRGRDSPWVTDLVPVRPRRMGHKDRTRMPPWTARGGHDAPVISGGRGIS